MKRMKEWLPALVIMLWGLSIFSYHWGMSVLDNQIRTAQNMMVHDYALYGMVSVNGSAGIMIGWNEKLKLGYVLTCRHVTHGHKKATIEVPQSYGEPYKEVGDVLYVDDKSDLAIVTMTKKMLVFDIMSDKEFQSRVKPGMAVWAAGQPTEDVEGQMLTYGHVVDPNRSFQCPFCPDHETVTGISHDATMWYGFSGGPLIDASTGKVIGINFKLGPSLRSLDGMAIPAPAINTFLKKIGLK